MSQKKRSPCYTCTVGHHNRKVCSKTCPMLRAYREEQGWAVRQQLTPTQALIASFNTKNHGGHKSNFIIPNETPCEGERRTSAARDIAATEKNEVYEIKGGG